MLHGMHGIAIFTLAAVEEDNADSLGGMCLKMHIREQTEHMTSTWYDRSSSFKGKTMCCLQHVTSLAGVIRTSVKSTESARLVDSHYTLIQWNKESKHGNVIFDPDWNITASSRGGCKLLNDRERMILHFCCTTTIAKLTGISHRDVIVEKIDG